MVKKRTVAAVALVSIAALTPLQAEAQNRATCRVAKVVQVVEERLYLGPGHPDDAEKFPQQRIKSTIVRSCAPSAVHRFRTQVVYTEWSPNWFDSSVHTG